MKLFAAIPLFAGLLLTPALALSDGTESRFEVSNGTSEPLHIVVDGSYACDARAGKPTFTCRFASPCAGDLSDTTCVPVDLGGTAHSVTVTAGSQTVTKSFTLTYNAAEDDPDLGPMPATYLGSCNVLFFGQNLSVTCV